MSVPKQLEDEKSVDRGTDHKPFILDTTEPAKCRDQAAVARMIDPRSQKPTTVPR